MSTNLFWRPVRPEPEGTTLPYELKSVLAKRYLDHDGSLGSEWSILDGRELAYLEGICDATHDEHVRGGVLVLMDAIKKYGSIEIRTA